MWLASPKYAPDRVIFHSSNFWICPCLHGLFTLLLMCALFGIINIFTYNYTLQLNSVKCGREERTYHHYWSTACIAKQYWLDAVMHSQNDNFLT